MSTLNTRTRRKGRFTPSDITWERVTRRSAASWIKNTETVGFKNRKLTTLSAKLEKAFKPAPADSARVSVSGSGFFSETGESIKLALDEETGLEYVIDGNNRMTAFIASGVRSHNFYVHRYVAPEMFRYMDTGVGRDLKTLISIHGDHEGDGWGLDPVAFSSFAQFAFKQASTGDAAVRPPADQQLTAGEHLAWLVSHYPDLPATFEHYRSEIKDCQRGGLGAHGIWLWVVYNLRERSPEKAQKIMEYASYRGRMAAAQGLVSRTDVTQKTLRANMAKMAEITAAVVTPPTKNWEFACDRAAQVRAANSDKINPNTGAASVGVAKNQVVAVLVPQAYFTAARQDAKNERGKKAFSAACEVLGQNLIGDMGW